MYNGDMSRDESSIPAMVRVDGDSDAQGEKSVQLQSTISDLIQVSHRLARLASHVSGNTESPATWRTISVLLAFGPMRLGELAERSRVSQPTMTKIVRGLVEREWVKRVADTEDARAWQIAVTSRGQHALEGWRHTIGAALAPLFETISDDELRTLQRTVEIISTHERAAADFDGPVRESQIA